MSPVENNQANKEKCSCPGCPSYNDCSRGKKENLFCAIGKSACAYSMNGCLCHSCPVHAEYNLQAGYYCLHGSAAEIEDK